MNIETSAVKTSKGLFILITTNARKGWSVPCPGFPERADEKKEGATRPTYAKDLLKAIFDKEAGMPSVEYAGFLGGYVVKDTEDARTGILTLQNVLEGIPAETAGTKVKDGTDADAQVLIARQKAELRAMLAGAVKG